MITKPCGKYKLDKISDPQEAILRPDLIFFPSIQRNFYKKFICFMEIYAILGGVEIKFYKGDLYI